LLTLLTVSANGPPGRRTDRSREGRWIVLVECSVSPSLGGLAAALLSWLLVTGRTLNPASTVVLTASLGAFGVATVWGGWTLADAVRGRIDAANRRRRAGVWVLGAAVLL
jgi:hypothetical protein